MEIENTFIQGLKLIHLNQFADNRGKFQKVFNSDFFEKNGLATNFKESYYSISSQNVIRGMHFQISPFEHTKLVYVNQGAIVDVVVDIRKSSPTYGKFFRIQIDDKHPVLVYIPVGCAHGFLSLEDHTMVTYLQTSVYSPECDKGILYNSFGMDWGVEAPVISERDSLFPCYSDMNYFL